MPKNRGRTHHMLVSAWGKRWRSVQLAMFTAYIDDSGSSPSQPIANATALVIPGSRILALQSEWDKLKKREGFSDFHTSVFIARNHHSKFADWPKSKQKRVLLRVRQIIKKFGVKIFSFTVNKLDYEEVVPPEYRSYAGTYHYTWAIRHIVAMLAAWRTTSHATDPLEYVFDSMKKGDKTREEIETVMAQAEHQASEKGMAGEYLNYSFRRRQDIPGLQCVDCIAWTCYQFGLFVFRKRPMPPLAQIVWDDLCSRNGPSAIAGIKKSSGPLDWFCAGAVTRSNLEKFMQKEITDGISIQRFRDWEKTKTKKV
jgi:hypothetical protein